MSVPARQASRELVPRHIQGALGNHTQVALGESQIHQLIEEDETPSSSTSSTQKLLLEKIDSGVSREFHSLIGRESENVPKSIQQKKKALTRTAHGNLWGSTGSNPLLTAKNSSGTSLNKNNSDNDLLSNSQKTLSSKALTGAKNYFKSQFYLGINSTTNNNNESPEGKATDAGLLNLVGDLEKNEILALTEMKQSERLDFLSDRVLPKFKTAEMVASSPDEDMISNQTWVQNLSQFLQCTGVLETKNEERLQSRWRTYWFQMSGCFISWFTEENHEAVDSMEITPDSFLIKVPDEPHTIKVNDRLLRCSSQSECDKWFDTIEKTIEQLKDQEEEEDPGLSVSIKAFYSALTVNGQTGHWVVLNIYSKGRVVTTILRSLAQIQVLQDKLKQQFPTINYPTIPDPPLSFEDLTFHDYIQEYFNNLLKEKQIEQSIILRGFLSTLPTDLSRRLASLRLKRLSNFLIENQNSPKNIVIKACLIDKDRNRVSEFATSLPSDENGKWNDVFTFNISNSTIAGILLEFHSVAKVPYYFGNIFIPKSAAVYRSYIHHCPIRPIKQYPALMHGLLELEIKAITHGDFSLPKIVTPVPVDTPKHKENRERERKQAQQRIAGYAHISYTYRPPTRELEGALIVRLNECKNLDSKDPNGKSDPYVCLEIVENGQRHCFILLSSVGNQYKPQKYSLQSPLDRVGSLTRSRTIKETLDPVYDEEFIFFIKPHDPTNPFFLDVNIWDYDRVGGDDFIGNYQFFETDLVRDETVTEWYPVSGIFTEEDTPKKVGLSFKERGFRPKYPIVLVPGFCSSGLKVIEGDKDWVNQRIWLSLTKLTGETKAARAFRWENKKPSDRELNKADKKEGELEEWEKEPEQEYRNRWLNHMCLAQDGCSDRTGMVLRPVAGTDGVAYLAPGKLTNSLSYVMGPLIENLKEVGYEEGRNLYAASYDWRIPPHYNEERDKYFSHLSKEIEKLVRQNKEIPVCLVAHSMGNRTTQYFLHWAETNLGRGWIDRHVHNFIALGAPFLGAPKSVRGLCSGERLGLETFLSESDGLVLARSIGSTPFLFPVGCNRYFDEQLHGDTFFTYVKNDEDDNFVGKALEYCLRDSGAERQLLQFDDYYMKNPLFGGEHEGNCKIIQPPPVKKLTCIYGINLPTEVKYFFEKNKTGTYVLKSPKDKAKYPGLSIDKGTGSETEYTPQHYLRDFTGYPGTKSGDGTVPYASLAYPEFWREYLDLEMIELYGAEHREMLNNRMLFWHVLNQTCQAPGELIEEAHSLGESVQLHSHTFSVQTFKTPTYCKFCSKFLWGVYKQGYECSTCLYPAHKGCYNQVGPTCTGERPNIITGVTEKITMGTNRIEAKAKEGTGFLRKRE